jgi:hypothetical protein
VDPLTRRHRAALERLSRRTVAELALLWPSWDPTRPRSWDQFAFPATLLIEQRSLEAAAMAVEYYRDLRVKHVGEPLPRTPAQPEPWPRGAIVNSIHAVGMAGTYVGLRLGRDLGEAKRIAFQRVARAAQRHVVNGSRETVVRSTREDPAALGWLRVIAGTCDYCAQRAADGVVPPGKAFEAHDGCKCSGEPKFGFEHKPSKTGLYPEYERRAEKFLDDARRSGLWDQHDHARMIGATRKLREAGGNVAALAERYADEVRVLDEMFAKHAHTFSRREVLFRGVEDGDWLPKTVGETFTEQGYAFTTVARAETGYAGAEGWTLNVYTKAGDRAIAYPRHNSMLFPRGTKLRVVNVDKGARIIEVEVV